MLKCDFCKKEFDETKVEILKLRTKTEAWTRRAGTACHYPWNVGRIPASVPYTAQGLKAAGIQVRLACPNCARPKN